MKIENKLSEKDLDAYVQKYIHGDRDAFDIIYIETLSNVFYAVYKVITNVNVLDDLIQETYQKVFLNISKYELGTNFYGWITRIASNTAKDYLKKKKMEVPDNDTIELVSSKIESKEVDDYYAMLMGMEKELFSLLIIEGKTAKEVSEIMNINLNRVYYLQKIMNQHLKQIHDEIERV